jgi:hypothetical protein
MGESCHTAPALAQPRQAYEFMPQSLRHETFAAFFSMRDAREDREDGEP